MNLRSVPTIALLWTALTTCTLAQAPSSRLDDLAERLATFAERNAPDDLGSPPAEGLSEELRRLNPGREQVVAEYVSRTEQCSTREIAAAMPRAVRSAARALGEERLSRLVAFLEGPGGAELQRSRAGERVMPMSEAATEGWERVEDDYKRWMYSIPSHMGAESFARAERCYEDEAARLGLRVE